LPAASPATSYAFKIAYFLRDYCKKWQIAALSKSVDTFRQRCLHESSHGQQRFTLSAIRTH